MTRHWVVVGVLGAFGCAAQGPAAEGSGGSTSTTAAAESTSSSESSSSESSSSESSESSTTATTTTAGEATTDYPTHMTCDETGAGYDIPGEGGDGGDSTSGAEDTSAGMGDDIPVGATVFEVRQGGVPAGSWVEVADLVITSPVGEHAKGFIVFAQAPEGGMWSGITLIFRYEADAPLVGERVTVRGDIGERYVFTAIFVDDFDGFMIDGTAPVPAPVVLVPEDLLPGAPAAEAYESAIVRVENPEVEEPESCVGEFTIDAGVRIDDLFLGADAPNPAAGDTFSAVNGPLRYTYNGFEIAPRTLDDVEL